MTQKENEARVIRKRKTKRERRKRATRVLWT